MIQLEEDDPRAVEAMIHFMYDHEYDSSGGHQGRISPMLFNVEVYRVADKYGVAALKKLSREKFDYAAKTCWDMDDFPHLITDVYSSSPCQELRETIAGVSRKHMEALLKKDNFLRVLNEAISQALTNRDDPNTVAGRLETVRQSLTTANGGPIVLRQRLQNIDQRITTIIQGLTNGDGGHIVLNDQLNAITQTLTSPEDPNTVAGRLEMVGRSLTTVDGNHISLHQCHNDTLERIGEAFLRLQTELRAGLVWLSTFSCPSFTQHSYYTSDTLIVLLALSTQGPPAALRPSHPFMTSIIREYQISLPLTSTYNKLTVSPILNHKLLGLILTNEARRRAERNPREFRIGEGRHIERKTKTPKNVPWTPV